MLTSKETGYPISHFLGAVTTTDNTTFECIETVKTIELYVYDGVTFDCSEKGTFVGSYPNDLYSAFEAKARLIRDVAVNSDFINNKCKNSLKNYYNDYYKYDSFFEEIA